MTSSSNMRRLITLCESAAVLSDKFRQWFGQSQVVTADGSPLVVYHGSNYHAYVGGEINVFQTLPASGRGAAFFSSSQALAGEYGEKVYSVYLRMENPLVVFGDGKSWTSLDHTTRIGGRVTDKLRAYHHKRAQDLDAIFRDLASIDGEDTPGTPTPSKIPDDVADLDRFRLAIMPDLEATSVETDTIVKQARRMGYDGVVFRAINDSPTHDRSLYKNIATDVYAVFHPGQVKSVANHGQWDRNDPDINA
jgi:hypothetical protein